jgi:hypothetical protein
MFSCHSPCFLSCYNRRLVVSSLHLASTKLSPFLCILVLGVFGRARRSSWWSVERPPTSARVLRFAPIPSLSLSRRHISHPQSSLHFYTLSSWRLWTSPGGVPGDPCSGRPHAPVLRFVPILSLSLSLSLSLRGGGMKWSARLVTFTFSWWWWWSEVERALLPFCQVSCHVARRARVC